MPLIVLKLPICGQVGEEIETYMNCLIENIENFDDSSMKSQLEGGTIIVVGIKCLEENEYFKEFSIDDLEIGEGYCWVGRVEIKGRDSAVHVVVDFVDYVNRKLRLCCH